MSASARVTSRACMESATLCIAGCVSPASCGLNLRLILFMRVSANHLRSWRITSRDGSIEQGLGDYNPLMCNLYSLNKKRDAVARFFRVSHNRASLFEPTTAIFPKHVAPVVRCADDGEREIVTMSWGFMLLQNGKAPRPVTNVRDDTILKSSFWKSSFQERRCLVPASSFCEPNGDVKPATWHWFSLKGTDERPLFAFPGIWRRYK